MTLHFPNPSRNYNPTQRCVCFWGHDSAFEVSFHLDEEALCKVSPYVDRNEASLLHAEDEEEEERHEYEDVRVDFRGALKARAMALRAPIQIIWPTTYDNSAVIKRKFAELSDRTFQDEATRA